MNKSEKIKGYVSLNNLCKMLGISSATGKNWLKLGKIIPTKLVSNKVYFDEIYCKKLLEDLQNGKNSNLKSRRNKKFKNGFGLYKSYISEDSKNLPSAQKLIGYFENKSSELTQSDIEEILAYYALKILKSFSPKDFDKYEYLCREISQTDNIVKKHPFLKELNFVYEKDEDILGLFYLSLSGINLRKSQGSYYTPTNVVKKLIKNTFENYNGGKITDSCCGSANFILNLPEEIPAERVFAYDIDKLGIKIARLNFAMKYKIYDREFLYKHVNVKNFLFDKTETKYDYIIGNPPWAYSFNDNEKEILHKKFKTANGTNIESYDVMTEKALSVLNENGILSFVLPEAILNVKSHSTLRKIIIQNSSLKYLEYLGETFDGVQCPSVIAKILRNSKPFNTKGLKIKNKEKEFVISSKREVTPEIFDFNCSDDEYELLNKIENIPNKVTLKDNALFALGIVTGNNSTYLTQNKTTNNEPVLKGSDIEKFKIKEVKNYIDFNIDKFQQCAPESVFRAKEKLIYKFISNKLVFAYDNKQTLTLNSCNILIPKIKGLDIKYILAILNSEVAQFYFEKKFNSVKVLRSHIEQIPIPYVDYETQKPIIEIVDKIIKSKETEKLLCALNKKIKSLY